MKSISRFVLALSTFSTLALACNTRAAGLVIEKNLPRSASGYKVLPFTTEGANTGSESYFTDKNGKVLRIEDDLILKIIRFPDVRNLTDQSSVTSLQAAKSDLQNAAQRFPSAKPYIAPQIAAVEDQITRFQSGERMVNGKWMSSPAYQKFAADAAAAQAAAEAERARRIAEQQAAEKVAEEKRMAEQKALEEKRAAEQRAKEKARQEKEEKAEADLKRANEEFEATEKRAAQDYQGATKGVLSGQVFVSTRGGESVKLGAVQVSLFARDAINILVNGLKAYADAKIELSHESSAAAKAAMEQAEAAEQIASDAYLKTPFGSENYEAARQTSDQARQAADAAREQYFRVAVDESFYYTGDFYFGYLHSPLQTAETDADGKFAIEVPRTGSFVIGAQNRRSLWEKTEKYYWLQPVSLEGQQQRVQNLSNNSLTSATGTSALILTKD